MGLGGVEDTKKELLIWFIPRAVGELKGGVTGALIEPPGRYMKLGSLDDEEADEDDVVERCFSHGMSD